jgi:hypothetical protein
MANNSVGIRIEKGEWLIPVSVDVLKTIFEAGLHPGSVSLRIKSARKSKTLRRFGRNVR